MKINQSQKSIPVGWKICKASDCIDVRDGTHATPKPVAEGVPLITSKNIVNGDLNLLDSYNVSHDDAREINKRSRVVVGDILISMIGTVGEAAIIKKEPNFVVKNVGIFKAGSKEVLSSFLIKQFHSTYLQNKIRSLSSGGIQKFISLGQLRKLPILITSLPEQNRIVSVLETWDKAIEKLSKKIEVKKQIKKGLTDQYIYKRNDSNEYLIEDLFELGRGRVISRDEIENNSGAYPVYSSQTSNNGIFGEINTYDFEGEYLTWTTDGAHAGRVFYRTGRFNCTNVCGTAKLKPNLKVNLYFVYTYLNYITKNYVSYVGNPKLMNGVFAKIQIKLPHIKEQNKIANILMIADQEIGNLEKKLKALKEQKRYLLNNLITGTIRTPETLSTKLIK